MPIAWFSYRIYSIKRPTSNKRPPPPPHLGKVLLWHPTSNKRPPPKNNNVQKRSTGIDYYSIIFNGLQNQVSLSENFMTTLKFFSKFSLKCQCGRKVLSAHKISRSNFVSIALFGVRVLNVPGRTSPLSSVLDPVTLTETSLSS